MFFPEWAERFDFTRVEWLEQEVFPDPPEGRRRVLDLVAKLPAREPVGEESTETPGEWLSLIHVEIESANSVVPLRKYMFRSYANLRDRYDLPVLPLAIYLRVGLDGTGTDTYREFYGPLDVLTFKYLYVGLPALDALEYTKGENLLAAGLSGLMKISREIRVQLKADMVERLAKSSESEQRKFLLAECLQAYLTLESPDEQQAFEQLIAKEEYREAKLMATTWFEQGMEQGLQQGQRELLIVQLEERFGPVSPQVRQRIMGWPAEDLKELARKVLRAESLGELGLEDQS